jgi:Fe-S cluster assembly protein SufD
LRVEPQVRCSEPLLVMQVSFGSNQASACLNRIELGLGSQAVLLEQCISLTQEPCWSNQWLHVGLAQQAQLTHVRWLKGGPQTWQWSRLCIEQQQGSQYHGHSFAVAGRLGRQEVEVNLSEAGAAAHVAGAWWATGQEHQDVHTLVRHQAPGCESSQTFKGVLDGRARAVFDGRIVVAEQAQKTVARQANHNLLLSGDAEVDTKPQLEILADDVKCSHGTTVGQLNQDQLFYLLARGVGLEAARAMLIEAFVQEIAQDINHSKLREVMTQRLHEVLHG